jgi:hypothetical protein
VKVRNGLDGGARKSGFTWRFSGICEDFTFIRKISIFIFSLSSDHFNESYFDERREKYLEVK